MSGCLYVFMKFAVRNALAHEETRVLALHDPLTGLANRRYMELDLQKGFDLAVRYGNPLSIIMAAIDFFKKYKDTHGHGAGDLLLAKVAGIIHREMRKTDLAARYGGEEFLMVLPHTELGDAMDVAERIRRNVEAETCITLSLGVSAYHQATTGSEEIVAGADKALYRAKQNGRNRIEVDGVQK